MNHVSFWILFLPKHVMKNQNVEKQAADIEFPHHGKKKLICVKLNMEILDQLFPSQ